VQLEDYFEFESAPVERIRLKGTRIDIDFVIELHKMHLIPEQIAIHFGCPLETVQVYAAITYYLQNRDAMDAYLARRGKIGGDNYQAYLAQSPSEAVKRIRALRSTRAGTPTESP
jgi:uncharacterized protein (DUF433 family)